ncbi:MAG: fimbrillin family protein [Bacteroidaceae bacterium]|nr:fimbrillin family protein [Bacteroidaceae bacterium]
MKLYNRILMLMAAVTLTVTGCQSELLTEVREQSQSELFSAIDFGNGLIDNPVSTRAVTRLSDHTTTMGVWGWQSLDDDEFTLFNNEYVFYSDSIDNWTYRNKRYWDSKSTYRFYAYAPHSRSVDGAEVNIDRSTGIFTINGVELTGGNALAEGGSRTLLGTLSGVTDVDWLIDRAGKTGISGYRAQRVVFNMQHILSKFNVLVKTSGAVSSDAGTTITVDSIIIGRFKGQADFVQRLDHSPNPDNVLDQTMVEWSLYAAGSSYSIRSAEGVAVDGQGMYVIESLIIPQATTADQFLKVCYTMSTGGGRSERFTSLMPFDMFDRFMSGCNYTLTISIGPDVITFDTGCEQWTPGSDAAGYIY